MSGFKEIEEGSVKLIHASTSSLVRLVVDSGESTDSIWLSYSELDDLKKVLKIVDEIQL